MAKKAAEKMVETPATPELPPQVLPLQGTDRLMVENSALKVQLLRERAVSLQRELAEVMQAQLQVQEDVLLRTVTDGDLNMARELSTRYVYDGNGSLVMQSPRPAR